MNTIVIVLRASPDLARVFALSPLNGAFGEQNGIDWQPWSDVVFVQAKTEGPFVSLDLAAEWCHVMDEITYHPDDQAPVLGEKRP